MASSVFYRFRSRKEESKVTFDGTGISVFDLKKEILLANNLGKANDFDLAVYDSSEQEYKDDTTVIPRSSSVIVRILPAARPGKGKAAIYLAGADAQSKGAPSAWNKGPTGPMSRRFDTANAPPPPTAVATTSSTVKKDEAAGIAAMFEASAAQWEETQEKMSHATRIYNPRSSTGSRKTQFNSPAPAHVDAPQRPTPPGYVCYRCGQKGHWIQDCPTNNDREFDNRPRIKRTTGIPRSFLKPVEQPKDGAIMQGVMVTPDGGYVVAQPDSSAWQKQRAKPKLLTEADVREKPVTDTTLSCPMCSKLLREAVKTPCCSTVYCEECIQTHLLEHDFDCPSCHTKIASLDKLVPDKPTRARVKAYVDKALADSRTEADANSDGAAAAPEADGQPHSFDGQPGDASMLFQDPAQLQAQIDQIHVMLRNQSLPPATRTSLQMELQRLSNTIAQVKMMASFASAVQAATSYAQNDTYGMGGFGGGSNYQSNWTNPFPNQQPAGQDSAYQRLPVNNRRRGMKRERPSDFLEVGGEGGGEAKMARYWE